MKMKLLIAAAAIALATPSIAGEEQNHNHDVAEAEANYTKGVVKSVKTGGKVTVIHEELVDLGMPAMTMVFRTANDEILEALSEGQEIEFLADRVNGKLTITKLK